MANLFNLAANEMSSGSLYYLGSIFGSVGDVLPGTGPALLGTMFKVFNTATLALGTIIITYTTIVSVIMTAHEGEMLGKKFHTLWIPLRTVFGISALVPTATGYSYLQMGMMWFIVQGVGAADTLWTTVWNYVHTETNQTAPRGPGSMVDASLKMQIGLLFQGLVCQAAEKATNNSVTDLSPSAWRSVPDSDMLSLADGSPQVSGNTYKMGPSGICGAVNWSSPEGRSALQVIVPSLGGIAAQFVAMNDAYNAYANNTAATPPPVPTVVQNYCSVHPSSCKPDHDLSSEFPPPSLNKPNANTVTGLYWPYGIQPMTGDFLTVTTTLYTSLMNAAAGEQAANSSSMNPTGTAALDNGWVFAGAYYYDIVKINRHAATVAMPKVDGPGDISSLPAKAELAYNASRSLIDEIQKTSSSTGSTGPGSLGSGMIDGWVRTLSESNQNPVVTAQQFGNALLLTIEVAYPIFVATSTLLAYVANFTALGTGYPGVFLSIQMLLLPVLYFFAIVFFTLGGTLAIYTPMIPYMLFTFGVINWLIATIETMIAAPIVAIGFLYPEGAHELWGKAEASIMLILNIFLRPSLMIFGMMSGMLMSYVAITFLNQGFMYVVRGLAPDRGFIESVLFMCLYTTLFVTIINKCFELIHIIPDKILRWVGGGSEQFGSGGQDLEKVGSGFKSGQEGTSGAMKEARGGVEQFNKSYAKALKKQGEADGKDKTTGNPESGKSAVTPASDKNATGTGGGDSKDNQ